MLQDPLVKKLRTPLRRSLCSETEASSDELRQQPSSIAQKWQEDEAKHAMQDQRRWCLLYPKRRRFERHDVWENS